MLYYLLELGHINSHFPKFSWLLMHISYLINFLTMLYQLILFQIILLLFLLRIHIDQFSFFLKNSHFTKKDGIHFPMFNSRNSQLSFIVSFSPVTIFLLYSYVISFVVVIFVNGLFLSLCIIYNWNKYLQYLNWVHFASRSLWRAQAPGSASI